MAVRILVACEESQAVTKELRALGHEAYSCDIGACSGGHPEWHIMADVLPLLNGFCFFHTMDATEHYIDGKWDMIIAFPPCTHLADSGAKHFAAKRSDGRQQAAIKFFMQIVNADCERIAIENPVGIISGKYIRKWFPDLDKKYGFPIKPSQIIHPWQFGHPYEKTTCIWLKGIRPLRATKILKKPGRGWVNQSFTEDGRYGGFNGEFGDAKTRSKTFHGIAKAMAEQWAGIAHERG